MTSREVIKVLKAAGWYVDRINGSHHILAHDGIPGTVTVPHPKSDLTIGTLKSIERQAGIKLKGAK